MSEPKKHHFVPQVYLNNFADHQKRMFQGSLRFKKISETHPSKVCYRTYYNTIVREEARIVNGNFDPLHLETRFFKKQEDQFGALCKKVTSYTSLPQPLKKSEAFRLIEILITIKRRNPTVKDWMVEAYRNAINAPGFKPRIQPVLDLAKEIDRADPEPYYASFVDEINSDSTRLNDAYLLSFIDDQKRVTERAVGEYLKHKIFMLHAPSGSQFITSDNPGFTVVNEEIVNYGALAHDFMFVFPLTPAVCLVISASEKEVLHLYEKPIFHKQINSQGVDEVNMGTIAVANEKMFGSDGHCLKRLFSLVTEDLLKRST